MITHTIVIGALDTTLLHSVASAYLKHKAAEYGATAQVIGRYVHGTRIPMFTLVFELEACDTQTAKAIVDMTMAAIAKLHNGEV